ncbi:MAG: hypothetical protein AAFN79_16780 [Pseudomonadota bacterium]
MRMSILIGLVLVVLGGAALYQIRNGFFMYAAGHLTHWPPSEPADIAAEFTKLEAESSETLGISLGQVANARVACASDVMGASPNETVAKAFRRLNLVLLGVGVNSYSPVIPPNARRMTELRRDLTRDSRPWREPDLNSAASKQLDDVIDELTAAENGIYVGLDLISNFGHLDFTRYVEAMMKGGEPFHLCVADRRV